MQRTNAQYGKGSHSIEVEFLDPVELVARLRAIFRDPKYRPPVLPGAALELMRLSSLPNVALQHVHKVLESDQMVTGRVLQIAQSPIYNPSGGSLSLQQALVRLGLKTLSDVFLEVSMNMRVFRAPGYDAPMNLLRRHATATAHLARLTCRQTAIADEHAFLCGLLHDAGIAAALIVLGDVPRGQTPPAFEDVWSSVLEVHEEVAGILAQMWKLPPDVTLVLQHHHSCTIGGHVHPLTAAIAIAEGLAHEAGFALDGDSQAMLPEVAVTALRLQPRTLQRIREDAAPVLARIE